MAEQTQIGHYLLALRLARQLTQRELGERLGVSPQTISNWENNRSHIPSGDLPAVATALGVSISDLYNESTQPGDRRQGEDSFNVSPLEIPRTSGVRPLPIYRWGSLGDPRDRESSPHPDREEYPPTGREYLIGPNGFGVDVRGTSMIGRDLHDGDVCWVNPDRPYRLGDLVLALVTNGAGESGMVIKCYARTEVGECLLSETAEGKTPVLCKEFKIVGPVVGVQRWFPPR